MNIFTEEEQRKKQLLAEQAKLQAEQAKAAQEAAAAKAAELEKVTPKATESFNDQANLSSKPDNPPPASSTPAGAPPVG